MRIGRKPKLCEHGILGVKKCADCRKKFINKYNESNKENLRIYRLEWQKNKRKENPQWAKYRDRKQNLKRYGLTLEDYDNLLELQNGFCAICKKPPNNGKLLVVDHNHETGVIRGLLHPLCNRALGFLQEDPIMLLSAANYLKSFEKRAA